jgi:hypothetical protein
MARLKPCDTNRSNNFHVREETTLALFMSVFNSITHPL